MTTIKKNIPLFLLLIVATGMRFYNLAGQSLWSDEGNSLALVKHGYSDIAQRTAYDIHPPFYYWLLKLWTTIFGTTEIGLRALSAMLGVILVYLTYLLGRRLLSSRIALIATFISALSPLQIHYSQETRMYILLAVLSTLTVFMYISLHENILSSKLTHATLPYLIAHITVISMGLYTHYAYPLILIVVGLFFLFELAHHRSSRAWQTIISFSLIHLIPILFYLPWLPIAWRQLTSWPSEKLAVPLSDMLGTITTTMLFGLSWPYQTSLTAPLILGITILIPLGTAIPMLRVQASSYSTAIILLVLWLILPIIVTMLIFSPAFLKFLLVATPPLTLLLALTISAVPRLLQAMLSRHIMRIAAPSFFVQAFLMMIYLTSSLVSLTHYHSNPVYARDNYRGIVNFIKAVRRDEDAVILNAEGQQDVFNYYYQPNADDTVYPLPRQRPLDETATIAELEQISRHAPKIYAIYWATQQADPQGLIEGWLDDNLFKATDQWYGNVRLVTYGNQITDKASCLDCWVETDKQFGENIQLLKYRLVDRRVMPGDILQIQLVWQTDQPISQNYIMFGQLLDGGNHLVGQRDAAPKLSTMSWPTSQPLTTTFGIFVEPGTPPGQHWLIIGLYNSQTGERLPILDSSSNTEANFAELDRLTIAPTTGALPIEAYNIHHQSNQPLGNITLLGYDLYKIGHRSTPDVPIHSGDPIRLVAYWQQNQTSSHSDELTLQVVDRLGRATPIEQPVPIAGVDYPSSAWQISEIVRAQYDLFLGGLEPGLYRIKFSRQINDRDWIEAETNLFTVK
ncbi:glycosyltransferase family 39 protein [Anaerolineales bacterium HSG6]|nr:glycosyltransferase family 39 protein [Anaerolineales bacterium HSG6]